MNLGRCYAELKNFELAIEKYEQAFSLFKTLENAEFQSKTLVLLSKVYEKTGKKD